jgi:hypothetical protein
VLLSRTPDRREVIVTAFSERLSEKSGREDLNLRPHGPEAKLRRILIGQKHPDFVQYSRLDVICKAVRKIAKNKRKTRMFRSCAEELRKRQTTPGIARPIDDYG